MVRSITEAPPEEIATELYQIGTRLPLRGLLQLVSFSPIVLVREIISVSLQRLTIFRGGLQ